jgi:large conductance mechanosensitive channel
MGMIKEFQDFAMKGNVVDLAVGVIIGAAFGKIVSALVDNVLMPPIGYLLGQTDFKTFAVALPVVKGDPVLIKYGLFLQAIIDFAIIAFVLFLIIKAMNEAKKRTMKPVVVEVVPPAAPPPSELYLREIRDALVKR